MVDKWPSLNPTHAMISHINMISSLLLHEAGLLLDTPGLQAPGWTDAALAGADGVTVQTVVD